MIQHLIEPFIEAVEMRISGLRERIERAPCRFISYKQSFEFFFVLDTKGDETLSIFSDGTWRYENPSQIIEDRIAPISETGTAQVHNFKQNQMLSFGAAQRCY
jgi:hypothetical protein